MKPEGFNLQGGYNIDTTILFCVVSRLTAQPIYFYFLKADCVCVYVVVVVVKRHDFHHDLSLSGTEGSHCGVGKH